MKDKNKGYGTYIYIFTTTITILIFLLCFIILDDVSRHSGRRGLGSTSGG